MKNHLILAGLIALSVTLPCLASSELMPPPPPNKCECGKMHMQKPSISKEDMIKKKEAFEKRLKLTDEQKAKAKELREQGKTELEPVFDSMKTKQAELAKAKKNNASKEEMQKLHKELGELHKKAHELKIQNMKKFESCLTKKQLKELDKMKKEGRKKFEKAQKDNKCKCGCKDNCRPPHPPIED